MPGQSDSDASAGDGSSVHRWADGWRSVLLDVLFVTAWVAVLSFGWGYMRWPAWAYYAVVFGGIVAYSLTFDP